MQNNLLLQKLSTTSFGTMTGRTQAVVAREMTNIERDIRVEEREYQKLYVEFLELINELNSQVD